MGIVADLWVADGGCFWFVADFLLWDMWVWWCWWWGWVHCGGGGYGFWSNLGSIGRIWVVWIKFSLSWGIHWIQARSLTHELSSSLTSHYVFPNFWVSFWVFKFLCKVFKFLFNFWVSEYFCSSLESLSRFLGSWVSYNCWVTLLSLGNDAMVYCVRSLDHWNSSH